MNKDTIFYVIMTLYERYSPSSIIGLFLHFSFNSF